MHEARLHLPSNVLGCNIHDVHPTGTVGYGPSVYRTSMIVWQDTYARECVCLSMLSILVQLYGHAASLPPRAFPVQRIHTASMVENPNVCDVLLARYMNREEAFFETTSLRSSTRGVAGARGLGPHWR